MTIFYSLLWLAVSFGGPRSTRGARSEAERLHHRPHAVADRLVRRDGDGNRRGDANRLHQVVFPRCRAAAAPHSKGRTPVGVV